MAKCSSCAAPLPSNSVVCAYCGTRNSVDLKGGCQEVPGEERTCPICKIPMKTINVGGAETFLIEKCDKCHGLFFDPGELDALLDKEVGAIAEIDYQRLAALVESAVRPPFEYRDCPVCGNMMNRVNFGPRSGVVVDRCREHGVFLDAGELRQLIDWRKAGGDRLHEEAKAKAAKKNVQMGQHITDSFSQSGSGFSSYSAQQPDEVNVGGALVGLLRLLFR